MTRDESRDVWDCDRIRTWCASEMRAQRDTDMYLRASAILDIIEGPPWLSWAAEALGEVCADGSVLSLNWSQVVRGIHDIRLRAESAERERDEALVSEQECNDENQTLKAQRDDARARVFELDEQLNEALARVRELEVECEDTRYKLTEPSSHVGNGFGDAKATIGGEARASQREDYPWPVSFVDERYAAESRALEAEQLCDHAHERLRVAIEQRDNALIDFGLEKAAHRVALQAEARERQRVLDLERRINSILLEVEEYRERFRVGILRENCLERAANARS